MIVIVTGGRDYAGFGLLEVLEELDGEHPDFTLIAGDADGADALAIAWRNATGSGVCGRAICVRAEWERYGRSAGPKRNAAMVHIAKMERRVPRRGPKHESVLCACGDALWLSPLDPGDAWPAFYSCMWRASR